MYLFIYMVSFIRILCTLFMCVFYEVKLFVLERRIVLFLDFLKFLGTWH